MLYGCQKIILEREQKNGQCSGDEEPVAEYAGSYRTIAEVRITACIAGISILLSLFRTLKTIEQVLYVFIEDIQNSRPAVASYFIAYFRDLVYEKEDSFLVCFVNS